MRLPGFNPNRVGNIHDRVRFDFLEFGGKPVQLGAMCNMQALLEELLH